MIDQSKIENPKSGGDSAECVGASRQSHQMTQIRSQRSEVSSQKKGRGLPLSPLHFALSLVGALLFALCFSVDAQQPKKIPRIGYVSGTDDLNDPGPEEAFRQGLRDLGYIEGKNILIEYRSQEGKADRGPSLVAELVQLEGRCACPCTFACDPRSQAGDQNDSHCHGDYCRSSRDRPSRQLGASGWKYHRADQNHP